MSLALYIHIPWCIRKCPYCDFNSHKKPDHLPESEYITALIADLKDDLSRFKGKSLTSIFFGGGTPSLFSAQAYERLLHDIRVLLPFEDTIEITLEANPGTVEQQRFTDYRALGINRLSLGIQSFNATHLKLLGRIHDDRQAHLAIERARQAGFDNINIDIMHGLPQQTTAQGLEDLKTALTYQPEHLSWYQLTIEPNTVFYKKQPCLPSEDEAEALETQGFDVLNEQGYQRYEISAFCRSDREAQHNLNYWLFGDYLGIGAGAHGKFTVEEGHQIFRTRKQKQPNDYLNPNKPFLAALERTTPADLMFEFMLNATRLQQAIPLELFSTTTGLSLDRLLPKLREAERKELINISPSHWKITALGRRYTNDLQSIFLPD